VPESFQQGSIVVRLRSFLPGFRGTRPGPSRNSDEEKSYSEKCSAGQRAARKTNDSAHGLLQEVSL
jgi:hypothetical protein